MFNIISLTNFDILADSKHDFDSTILNFVTNLTAPYQLLVIGYRFLLYQ